MIIDIRHELLNSISSRSVYLLTTPLSIGTRHLSYQNACYKRGISRDVKQIVKL